MINSPFGDRYIGAPLACGGIRTKEDNHNGRIFKYKGKEEAMDATKPQAASIASCPLPRPASQAGAVQEKIKREKR
jgi:hypothetical protein